MGSPPRLDDQLCFAVYAASRTIAQAYRPLLDRLGLTFPRYLVMMVLWEQDDVTVSHLGSRLLLDSGTLTPLLKQLQKQGLIARTRDPADERRVRITLTGDGHDLAAIAAEHHDALLCSLSDQDSHQLAVLRDSLRALTDRLRDHPRPPFSFS